MLMAKYIPFKPENAPKTLRSLLLLSALNEGDTATVRQLCNAGYDPVERDDPKWILATYLSVTGHEKEASAMIVGLKPASDDIQPRAEAMKTYLLAKSGQVSKAKARMLHPVDDFVVRGYNGMAYAAMGDWKHAEPLLQEQVKSRNWGFLYVTAKANAVLADHYRQIGGHAKDLQAIAYSAGASQPNNALFKPFSFALKPGVAQFAGTIKMDCVTEDDILSSKSMAADGKKTFGFGTLTITVSPTGVVTGTVGDGKNSFAFNGNIDPLGNFTGNANLKSRKFTIGAKLAPPAVYNSFPAFKTTGLIIEFVDSQGYRVVVVGHT